jgi:nucleotide-binding universal stress UspA family protein
MQNATLLLLTDVETKPEEISTFAARAMEAESYFVVLILTTTPSLPINAYGGMPFGGTGEAEIWSRDIQNTQAALKAQTNVVKKLLQDAGCEGEARPLICPPADVQDTVAQSAKYGDLIYVASNLRDTMDLLRDVSHGVLFQSPAGLMLNADIAPSYDHIMIAWNDSLTAARAVHSALPLLKAAKNVTIACFDPAPVTDGHLYEPGAALSVWLSHHGCDVEIAQYPTGGASVSSCILDRAREIGAGLVVAGAYSHSRMRQAIFGGTTRSLIEQSDQPVYLAH